MSDLLIKKTEGQLLDAFVGALRDFLGCDRWEERESVDYVEARYFRCSVLGLEVTVAIADSAEFKDYWNRICPCVALAIRVTIWIAYPQA
jgi:hypothetical protein